MAHHYFIDPVMIAKNILYYSYDKKRHDVNNQETIRRLKEYIAKPEKKKPN